MAVFECDCCGKCCVSLGPLITLERQLNDQDYYCRCKMDNSIFLAHVDKEFSEEIADEFADEDAAHSRPEKKPCMFLRKNPFGKGNWCAIYTTRPQVCRDFRCYRILVYNREGKVCARVIGKNTLRTEDTALYDLWNEQVALLPCSDTLTWYEKVSGVLAEQGYRADFAE